MTIEPVEIQHVKLGKSLLGYDRGAVERLLEEVTASFEEVWLERKVLRDQVERLQREREETRARDRRVGGMFVSAERIAQRRMAEARKRAEALLTEAEERAERIVEEARHEPEQLRQEIDRLETMEQALKARYRAFLTGAQRLLEASSESEAAVSPARSQAEGDDASQPAERGPAHDAEDLRWPEYAHEAKAPGALPQGPAVG